MILEDDAVADRFPGRELNHSIAAENYRAQVRLRQASLRRELEVRKLPVLGSVDTLSNAIFVAATPDRVEEMQALPGVKGVIAMRPVKLHINKATSLANVSTAWSALGGQSSAGAGMMIALIGTGIDQTHAAFQDTSLSIPSGFPKCTNGHSEDCNYTNNKVIVARSYVRTLSAGSSTDATKVAADSGPDDFTPRDHYGHETAIASIIAGVQNSGPAATITGMAPKAWLGNYKVYGSPGMPGGAYTPTVNGVTVYSDEFVFVQAINDAYNDGMHIANVSSGIIATTGPLDTGSACGQSSGVPCDYEAYNFEKAAQLGMVITVSAGNAGEDSTEYPTYQLMSSPATAPSVIAVGATLNSHVLQPSVSVVGGGSALQNISAQTSDAYSSYVGAQKLPVVDAAKVGDGYACSAFSSYALYNAVALIQQGGSCTYTTKATNAANAGAIGIIFYMNASGTPTPVEIQDSNYDIPLYGPVVLISQSDGQAIKTYIDANSGSYVLIDPAGTEMDLTAYNKQITSAYGGFSVTLAANQMLGFSSPGPTPGTLALKPDLVATGGNDQSDGPDIYNDYNFFAASGMYMATQSYDQASDMYSANNYVAANGTSFSAPLVAGAAALLWQLHPSYTAAQIKALILNTTATDVTTDNWGVSVDALNIGAGRLDVGAASKSTVIAQAVTSDSTNPVSVSFGLVTKLPVTQQLKITNLGTASVTLTIAVTSPVDVQGYKGTGSTVTVDKSSVTLAAGASSTVTLTISGTVPAADEYTGSVNITGTNVSIHVPYLFFVASGAVWDMQAIQSAQITSAYSGGCFEALPNGDAGYIAIRLIDYAGVPVAGSPVTFSVSPRNSATLKSYGGSAPACSPASSTSSVSCNTDAYGIAWVEVYAGASTSLNPLITAKSGSMYISFGGSECGLIVNAPTISSISESAVGGTNIAAGSYISLYGSNLANTLYVGDNTFYGGDGPTYTPLPMNLDYVAASFDIPGSYDGKPADYNGYPGRFTFVSNAGTQINLQVPWELQGASQALVKVTTDYSFDSNVITIPLVTYAPALFQSSGIVAAYDQTTYSTTAAAISSSNPAHAGDIVQLYANGLGPVTNQPASGAVAVASPLSQTKGTCTVTVGGKDAPVAFCGLAPGYPALYQVNITVPSGLSSGNQPVILSVGGTSSKSANLPIK